MDLASTVFGADRPGTPVIVMHGLFGSSRNWQALAKRLAAHAPVVTLDLRNHGDSPWAEPMTYAAMAEDVSTVIEQRVGGGPVAVLGHSMGGKVGMVLALTEPWLVERLLVLDIAPVRYPARFHSYLEAMQAIPLHLVTQRDDADTALEPQVPDAKVRAFLLRNLVETPDGWAWRANLAAIGRCLPDLLDFPSFDAGTRYPGPTRFLSGGRSDYVVPEYRPQIQRLFPAAEFDEIPEASHWVHADQPEEFLRRAAAFLFG